MPILCLHGIAQEDRDEELLRRLWLDSLRVGYDQAGLKHAIDSVVLPYYGDVLARLGQDGDAGNKRDPDANHRSAQAGSDLIDEVQRELVKRKRNAGDPERNERSAPKSFLKLLCRFIPKEAEACFVDLALRQVRNYLATPDCRNEVIGRAHTALCEASAKRSAADPKLVVIAHSLGSVVALDVLSRYPEHPVDLLLTIGSPLSIRSVHSRLLDTPPRWPRPVANWINIADPDDIVALYGKIDRTNFFGEGYAKDRSSRCAVLNVLDIKNHMNNHHGIAGYLDDPVVSDILFQALQPSTTAPQEHA